MDNYLLLLLGCFADQYYKPSSWPIEGTYAETKEIGRAAGGPPLNMGCVCASKGGNVKGIDYLSDEDSLSKFMVDTLSSYGVDTSYVQYGKAVNGKVLVMNTNEKRTMFVVMPERPYYVVDEKLQSLLNNSTYIYSMMHIIHRSFKDLEPLKIAREHGAKILLDGSSEYTKDWELDTLYSLCDGLFINKEDYQNLVDHSDKDPKEILFKNNCEFICITDGGNGAICYTKDKEIKAEACPTKIVDSTGAGDSFAGTFVYGLQKHYDYEKCLRLASVAGSYACTSLGGQAACCKEEDLYKYAKEHNYKID